MTNQKNTPQLYDYEDLTSQAQTKAEYDYAMDYSIERDEPDSSQLNEANEFLHEYATKNGMKFYKNGKLHND